MIAHMENPPRNVRSWLLAIACAAIACVVTALQPMRAYSVPPATENPASPLLTFALQQESTPALPTPYEHWTGDLDGMLKRLQVRALVVYNPGRQQKVAFSTPIMTGVKQIVVTRSSSTAVTTVRYVSDII